MDPKWLDGYDLTVTYKGRRFDVGVHRTRAGRLFGFLSEGDYFYADSGSTYDNPAEVLRAALDRIIQIVDEETDK